MNQTNLRGVTLLEVIVALTIFSMIIIGFGSIDYFVRFQMISSVRRAGLQNTSSFVMDHIQKHLMRTVGNEFRTDIASPEHSVITAGGSAGSDPTLIAAHIDVDNNGAADTWIGYRLDAVTHRVLFCAGCTSAFCDACSFAEEPIGTRISAFGYVVNQDGLQRLTDNFIYFQATSCWNPDDAAFLCGAPENPSVTMQANIILPSVATH